MAIDLDPNVILQAHLARSLGLDRYAEIMQDDPSSPMFQRLFNGYYRVRRNAAWRQVYYDLFLTAKADRYSFAQIITALYQETGNIEACVHFGTCDRNWKQPEAQSRLLESVI